MVKLSDFKIYFQKKVSNDAYSGCRQSTVSEDMVFF